MAEVDDWAVPAGDDWAVPEEGESRVGGLAKQAGIGTGEGLLEGVVQAVPLAGSISNLARATGLPGPIEGFKKLLGTAGLNPDDYPAQNFEQKVARTTGNILGNPLTYGPGAARNVALAIPSALGSETLGGMAEGTRWEGPAKVLGGLFAPTAASLAHRTIAPRAVPPENAAAAARLRQQGIDTTAAEVTGGKSLHYTEAEAGAPYTEFKQRQGRQLTTAALEPIRPTPQQIAAARTPEEIAAVRQWQEATTGHSAHDAVQVARPSIGREIDTSARALEVHSDGTLLSRLTSWLDNALRDTEGFAPNNETVLRLQRMRDNVLAAFDIRPGPRQRYPSWTGNWGNANQESTVTVRPQRTGPNRMWEVRVDGVHDNWLPTRADAQRYVSQYMPNMQPVVPPGRLIMNGRAFQTLIEHSSPLSRAARGNDSTLAYYAGQIREALMDAAERTGSRRGTQVGTGANAAYERFATARRQWANLLALEHAASGTGMVGGKGLLTPPAIRKAATFRDTSDYARGRGDFNQLARDSNALISEPPNSGTPGRLRLGARAVGAAIGATLGAGGGGGWGAAVLAPLGAAAAPMVQGRIAMSRPVQRYLRSGRFQPPDRETRRLRLLRHAAPFVAHQLANPYQP